MYFEGGEFDQSTLYACMEISQWNTFDQLTYTNKVEKKKNLRGDWRMTLQPVNDLFFYIDYFFYR
jgi:hypothetical protein